MSFNWSVYERPTRCTGSASPGARALLAYLKDRFGWLGSAGIYNCRLPSEHSEGRGLDATVPTNGGKARPELGDQVTQLLGPHGRRLGLTNLIYNRKIHSASSPEGRYYNGRHPHYDHHHIGLTRAAGANLTYATLVEVLGDPKGGTPTPQPQPADDKQRPYPGYAGRFGGYNRVEFEGRKDLNVAWIQNQLNRTNLEPKLVADGIFGAKVERAVQGFQGAVGLKVDGIVGPKCWAALSNH